MPKIVLANLRNSLWRYEKYQGEWLGHVADYHIISHEQINQFVDDYQHCYKIAVVICSFFNQDPVDLSKFDLVIVVNQEITLEELPEHLSLLGQLYSNNNIITVISEHLPTDAPHESVYRYPFFLTEIPMLNEYTNTAGVGKPKTFDALLGLNKKHRQFVFDALKKHNLLDKCYLSLVSKNFNDDNEPLKYIYYSDDLRSLETADALQAMDRHSGIFYSYTTDTEFQRYYPISRQMPYDIYKNSWYSIVTETNWQTWPFITEKTAKPLFAKRLFVIFSAPNHLKRLRELGFQTFDSIIDESYDLEFNHRKRYEMALEQVLLLTKLDPVIVYEKINSVLEHNHRLISDRKHFIDPLRNWLVSHIPN
jgi:hypothetical protein